MVLFCCNLFPRLHVGHFFLLPYHAACGILVPTSGIEPAAPAGEALGSPVGASFAIRITSTEKELPGPVREVCL